MIKIENFNVDSAIIDFTDTRMVESRRLFKDSNSQLWHREMSFVDDEGRCITLRLSATAKNQLEIKEHDY